MCFTMPLLAAVSLFCDEIFHNLLHILITLYDTLFTLLMFPASQQTLATTKLNLCTGKATIVVENG